MVKIRKRKTDIHKIANHYYNHRSERYMVGSMMKEINDNTLPLLIKAYKKYNMFGRYKEVRKVWYNMLKEHPEEHQEEHQEEHPCKNETCIRILIFILNMYLCGKARNESMNTLDMFEKRRKNMKNRRKKRKQRKKKENKQ